jgi:hypothetical protein
LRLPRIGSVPRAFVARRLRRPCHVRRRGPESSRRSRRGWGRGPGRRTAPLRSPRRTGCSRPTGCSAARPCGASRRWLPR